MRAISILLTLISTVSRGADCEAWKIDAGPVRSVGLIGEISAKEFKKRAVQLLGSRAVRAGKVTSYPTNAIRFRYGARDLTDCSYRSWLGDLVRERLVLDQATCPVVREAIKIGDKTMLRSTNDKCEQQKQVLVGGDPLLITVGGDEYTVVDVAFTLLPQDAERDDREARIHFYVRTTGEVTADRAKAVVAKLQHVTSATIMNVLLRNDDWFSTQCEFPVRFLFGNGPYRVPTEDEFLRGRQVICVADPPWPVGCH